MYENIVNSLVDVRFRDVYFIKDDKYFWVSLEIGGIVSIFDIVIK